PQWVVGEEVDEQGVGARLHAAHEVRRDGATLDHEHDLGTPRLARALEQAQDPELVGGLRRFVLVERVVAPVLEEPHRVTTRGELLAEIDAHEPGAIERKHDEPTHGPYRSTRGRRYDGRPMAARGPSRRLPALVV